VLNREDNELITRVGPGTPMGTLMRQYWVPAMLSSELPVPESDPLRVRVLGEALIGFRDTNGRVGLMQQHCPHRGASLFFGRNEEGGLRCVYHGWKFDVNGRCVDMPNEPAESDFRHKVNAVAYPTQERGGVVWVYLGTARELPQLPDLEMNMRPESAAVAFQSECNWLQILEGDIDTSHSGFLHRGSLDAADMEPGTFMEFQIRDRAPRYAVVDTEGGVTYGAYRAATPGFRYWRIAQFMFPFYTIVPDGLLGSSNKRAFVRVPLDDEHTMTYTLSPTTFIARPGAGDGDPQSGFGARQLPNTSDWLGRFRLAANARNDYQIDRQKQRTNVGRQGYSGIKGTQLQDVAATESQGPIFDRSNEALGSSDVMIIRTRRRLLAAARALQEQGIIPPGVADASAYRVRGGGVVLPADADWWEATKELRKAFVEHPDLDQSMVGVA
jgi:nitrite reductase/ring-hydroxylating ferredoxin subunit